ncbi:MAG: mobilization protein, partial [Dysgonamonadaceae bacterium]|nr:mobilization protein [Dysgonamonadaceae bacterium]
EYKGLVYSALNKNGEKVGNPFKSSLFGKSVGMEALEKRIEKSAEIIKSKGLKERSKQVIAAAMHTCKNRADFEKVLEKQGIFVLFRENEQGRIYGATFIDHEQKAVFNGSRLGKEFSANVFNDLFNGNGRKPEQRENYKAGQSFEPFKPSNREREEGSGIGGLFDLFTPETTGDEIAKQNFVRRLKKKNKRQRRI